jgi:hypothetical protein
MRELRLLLQAEDPLWLVEDSLWKIRSSKV